MIRHSNPKQCNRQELPPQIMAKLDATMVKRVIRYPLYVTANHQRYLKKYNLLYAGKSAAWPGINIAKNNDALQQLKMQRQKKYRQHISTEETSGSHKNGYWLSRIQKNRAMPHRPGNAA